MDGHERDDVVAYRKVFVEKITEFELQMPQISGDMLMNITWPEGQPLILVTHDESTFAAFDDQRRLWLPDGEQPLRKKRNWTVASCQRYSNGRVWALGTRGQRHRPT